MTIHDVMDLFCCIAFLVFNILLERENKHLRKLVHQMNEAEKLILKQNEELWKLSHVIPKDGDPS